MLGIGSGSFDPETLVILETAFDEAWITLKSNGSSNIRPNELARRICHLAMEGERDPVRLHDRALGELIPATIWRDLSLSRTNDVCRRHAAHRQRQTWLIGWHSDRQTPTCTALL
jgi:hypothetical protein